MEVMQTYFLLFMIYSFIGWCIEVAGKLYQKHRFINRGFLIGPYCPIYGYGALIMTFFLNKHHGDFLALFCVSMIICSVLEYITSYFMEKIFKARWWNYSQYKFNLNGRICLSNAILFGVGGVCIIELVNPILLSFIKIFPGFFLNTTALILLIIFVIDHIVSFKIMFHFKTCAVMVMKDSTEEISRKVRIETEKLSKKWKQEAELFARKIKESTDFIYKKREEKSQKITAKMKKYYYSKSYLYRRLIDAFPDFKAVLNIKIEKKVPHEITKSKRSKNKK